MPFGREIGKAFKKVEKAVVRPAVHVVTAPLKAVEKAVIRPAVHLVVHKKKKRTVRVAVTTTATKQVVMVDVETDTVPQSVQLINNGASGTGEHPHVLKMLGQETKVVQTVNGTSEQVLIDTMYCVYCGEMYLGRPAEFCLSNANGLMCAQPAGHAGDHVHSA